MLMKGEAGRGDCPGWSLNQGAQEGICPGGECPTFELPDLVYECSPKISGELGPGRLGMPETKPKVKFQ